MQRKVQAQSRRGERRIFKITQLVRVVQEIFALYNPGLSI
jgi:hypothetical protein